MRARLEITKSFTFESAHYFSHLPEGHPNRRVHGHSFAADITLAGEPDPESGWISDFVDVDAALAGVRAELDHSLLNEIEGLEAPSLENLALWLAARLRDRLPALVRVTVRRPSCGETCIYNLE